MLAQDNVVDISPRLKKAEKLEDKPAYKAEIGVSPSVLSLIPSSTTISALAIGIAVGLFAGFYFARSK